jgi:hypothetical protein
MALYYCVQDELKKMREAHPDHAAENAALAEARAYTLLLERQLVAKLEGTAPSSDSSSNAGFMTPSGPRTRAARLASVDLGVDSPRAKVRSIVLALIVAFA